MRWLKRTAMVTALMAVMFGAGNKAQAGVSAEFSVLNFNINTQLILELYNTIEQTSGHQIDSYPANLPPNVLTITVRNTGTVAQKFCLKLKINEVGGTKCVIEGGPISTKEVIQPGQTVTLNALSFETGMNFTGQFDEQWAEDTVDELADDPSAIEDLLKLSFNVCAVWVDCSTNTPGSPASESCAKVNLLKGGAGSQSSVSVLIFPHNQVLYNSLVGFVATPAFKTGVPATDINYTLEIMEGNSSASPWHVKKLGNSPNYQWKASDPKFKKYTEYFWRLKSSYRGKYFGGPSDRGWNIVKRFEIRDPKGSSAAAGDSTSCHYTVGEVKDYIMKNAPQNIRDELADMVEKSMVDPANVDPFVCALLQGKVKVTGWRVEKQ